MKQQKDNWVKILFSFAAPCKGKMALSVFCAILSVAGGFIPFWAVYEILLAFINQNVTLNGILIWCLVGAAGYLLRVACHGISTILAHISAYTILEGIRLKIADRLMKAPLGEVMGRRIGYLKNIIMDKVEDLEPPLAHMIPELTSNLLLPVAIFTWMMVIDWRMGLAVLIAPVLAMIPMFFLMRNYNSQYAAFLLPSLRPRSVSHSKNSVNPDFSVSKNGIYRLVPFLSKFFFNAISVGRIDPIKGIS